MENWLVLIILKLDINNVNTLIDNMYYAFAVPSYHWLVLEVWKRPSGFVDPISFSCVLLGGRIPTTVFVWVLQFRPPFRVFIWGCFKFDHPTRLGVTFSITCPAGCSIFAHVFEICALFSTIFLGLRSGVLQIRPPNRFCCTILEHTFHKSAAFSTTRF
jgi:hypothetical protein